MSEDRQPNGASPGPDDSAGMFPIETEEDAVSNPEKGQLVYPNSHLVQLPIGQLVYSNSNHVQHSVSGLEPSRKHGVPPSDLNTELTSNGNVQQFYGSAESKLHSKSLVNLQSPRDALPETGEGGKKRSMKLSLQQVDSSGNSYGRQRRSRRSRSEGTTPPKDKLEGLLVENRKLEERNKLLEDSLEKERIAKHQASNDESVLPITEQQLKDRITLLQKKIQVLEEKSRKEKSRIQSLQQKKKDESEEKWKFKALYDDEKQRNEEIEKKAAQFKGEAAQYKEEITKLQQVVYKLHTDAELSPEQVSLVRSIFVEQVVNELGEAAVSTEQEVPNLDEDLPAEPDGTSLFTEGDISLGQQKQLLSISQDEGSSMQTLCGYLESLARTGVGDKKVCNVCFVGEPIDSHIITRKLLEAACEGRECRNLFLVDLKRKSTTIVSPTTWVQKLECKHCDNSTSHLEGEFVSRCLKHYKPSIPLSRNDVLVFLSYGYRTLCMRNVLQYAVKDKLASYKELESFMVQVWKIRRALMKQQREIRWNEEFDCARNRVLFHILTRAEAERSSYRIALVLCNVDLTALDQDLTSCPLIYTKTLRCCWAVLLGEHKAANLQPHFLSIINCIDHQLSQEKIEPQGIVRKNSLKITV